MLETRVDIGLQAIFLSAVSFILDFPWRLISDFPDHLLRPHPLIELPGGHVAERDRGVLERKALLVRVLGDLRRFIVADVRVQRGDEHQRFTHQLLDARRIGLDAGRTVLVEINAAVRQQARAVQEIADHQRPKHVELEVARGAAEIDRHVVAEYLAAQHRQRFRLRRVDLARHDGAARLVFRDIEFPDAAARTAGQPAHVVGDFHQRGGERLQRAVRMHHPVARSERLELVGRRDKGQTGELRQFCRDPKAQLWGDPG